jgi:hypothetical protein
MQTLRTKHALKVTVVRTICDSDPGHFLDGSLGATLRQRSTPMEIIADFTQGISPGPVWADLTITGGCRHKQLRHAPETD